MTCIRINIQVFVIHVTCMVIKQVSLFYNWAKIICMHYRKINLQGKLFIIMALFEYNHFLDGLQIVQIIYRSKL